MKKQIKKAIDKIANIGIESQVDFYDQLRYRAFNLSLAAIVLAITIMIISDIIEGNETVLYSVLAWCFTLSIFVLNYYKRYFLAALLFVMIYPGFLFVISILYGEEMNITYVYFAFIILVLLAFESTWLKLGLSIYIFVLQLGGIYYNRHYGSIIEKDIPFMDGILILLLPTVGIGILVMRQVSAIKRLYDQQMKVNEELKVKNKKLTRLVEQNESKNSLLAIIAHDLKGPAASFNNLSKNIAYLIKKEQPERLEKMAYGFESAGQKFYYTISNLLNWVVSQKEHIVLYTSTFDLKSLLDEVIDSLDFQLRNELVDIRCQLDAPAISTDRNILKIILFNLLNNAIKFSSDEEEIVVRSSPKENHILIEVTDSGPGLTPELIKDIQREEVVSLYRRHTKEGHGIGLKICFALIKHLGGKITIESKIGQGATFGIWLPVSKSPGN